MKVKQIYTGCLAQGTYYVESNGEVAIIDPLREVKPYIDKAEAEGAKIKYIFETHFHADFVSGHVTLSKETGAPIIYGPNANPAFDAIIAEDHGLKILADGIQSLLGLTRCTHLIPTLPVGIHAHAGHIHHHAQQDDGDRHGHHQLKQRETSGLGGST